MRDTRIVSTLFRRVAQQRIPITLSALVLFIMGGMLWIAGTDVSAHPSAMSLRRVPSTLGPTASTSSLKLVIPSTTVMVNTSPTFTAIATLAPYQGPLNFQLDWEIGSALFSEKTTSSELTLAFTKTYTVTQIGRYLTSAKLYNSVPKTTLIVSDTHTLTVSGGVIDMQFDPTQPHGQTFVGMNTSLTLTLPAARPDAYRLVVDFGDQSMAVTSTVTSTLALPVVSTITYHRYAAPGTYKVSANVYPVDGPANATTLLATGSPANLITAVVGSVYLPLLTKPEPPPIIIPNCNAKNTSANAKPLDSSSGQAVLHATNGMKCNGLLQAVPEGGSDFYLITMNPGEVFDLQLTQLQPGADYDLYLYNSQNTISTNRVAKSNQTGTVDERFIYVHPLGSAPFTYYLRVYQFKKSATAENSYLITAYIK